MQVKNFSQEIHVLASLFYGPEVKFTQEQYDTIGRFQKDKPTDKEAQEFRKTLPQDALLVLDKVGATLPSDKVSMTYSLGELLAECYMLGKDEPPQSPVARRGYDKRLDEALDACTKETIQLKKEDWAFVYKTMADDKLWERLAIQVKVKDGKEFPLNHLGVALFYQLRLEAMFVSEMYECFRDGKELPVRSVVETPPPPAAPSVQEQSVAENLKPTEEPLKNQRPVDVKRSRKTYKS